MGTGTLPIRVFVGTAPEHAKAERALEHSIRRHASAPVEINWMRVGDFEFKSVGPTGFTLYRWCIPHLCNHEGYAIYLDVDMILTADIAELYEYRKPGKWVCNGDIQGDCVSVIDCSAVKLTPNEIRGQRKWDIRQQLKSIYDLSIPNEWNAKDCYGKLIHFTDLRTQPWICDGHKDPELANLWRREYADSLHQVG